LIRRDSPSERKIGRTPTPDDPVDAPELAILAALESVLELVARALVCAHPELADPERPYWLRQASCVTAAAETVIQLSAEMKQVIIEYREALEIRRQDEASAHPDDPTF
jgi:hypothetical protein